MKNFYIHKKNFREEPIYFCVDSHCDSYFWETESLECPFTFCVNFNTKEYISSISKWKDDIGKKIFVSDEDKSWEMRKSFQKFDEREMLNFVSDSFDAFHSYYMTKMKEYVDRIFASVGKDIQDSNNPLDMF